MTEGKYVLVNVFLLGQTIPVDVWMTGEVDNRFDLPIDGEGLLLLDGFTHHPKRNGPAFTGRKKLTARLENIVAVVLNSAETLE